MSLLRELKEINANTENTNTSVGSGNASLSTLVTNTGTTNTILTGAATTLTTISTNTGSADTKLTTTNSALASILLDTTSIDGTLDDVDTSLNNIETNTTNANTKLDSVITQATNLANDRPRNVVSKEEFLLWDGTNGTLSPGDYSSTTKFGWWRNTSGYPCIIDRIQVTYLGAPTEWQQNRMFDSNSSAATSYMRFGSSSNTTAVSTDYFYWNGNLRAHNELSQYAAFPISSSSDKYYTYARENMNFVIADDDYAIIELSGDYNSTDTGFTYLVVGIQLREFSS